MDPVSTDIEGAVPRNVIKVSDVVEERLVRKLTAPTNIKIQVPETIYAALYSDGTAGPKLTIPC